MIEGGGGEGGGAKTEVGEGEAKGEGDWSLGGKLVEEMEEEWKEKKKVVENWRI